MTQELKTKIEAKAEEVVSAIYLAKDFTKNVIESYIIHLLEEVINNPAKYLEQQPVSAVSDEYLKEGDTVVFTRASDEQVQWGGNDDPRKLLKLNEQYDVEEVEVHSWHTKIYLKGIKGKFNSVHFKKVTNFGQPAPVKTDEDIEKLADDFVVDYRKKRVQDHVIELDGELATGFVYGYKAAQQQPCWVKASERLPRMAGDITWRHIGTTFTFCGYKSNGFQNSHIAPSTERDYALVEWLDESCIQQQPEMQGRISLLEMHNESLQKSKLEALEQVRELVERIKQLEKIQEEYWR